ncbi:transcription factor [Bacillus phage MG-B1]|uniref:Transcription factor n=1 Tax=Bacillus phage MG-B1 TaxID=1309583 RepID=M4W6M2_9CAUD|nr:HNH endonuclease [Bacillus phage MG-B1]AGI10605.1 transcription factor [Bacillus phage MG-B1]
MGKLIDLTGQKFGRLTCIEMVGRQNGHVVWKFKCDCGKNLNVRGLDVRRGNTNSCGCYQKEQSTKSNKGKAPKDRKKMLNKN